MSYFSFAIARLQNKWLLSIFIIAASYAPIKDALAWTDKALSRQQIALVDISFGNRMPWQEQKTGYLQVSQSENQLDTPQLIYTRLKFDNPTDQPVTFRKIWLNFEHANGAMEYTTDYTLYDSRTHRRLIGKTIELGPQQEIEILAAYRFIPSYPNSQPQNIKLSWEGDDLLRSSACAYRIKDANTATFGHQCGN